MCKGLWCLGFIFLISSCGPLRTTRGEKKVLFDKFFSKDILHNIYTQCYQAPFQPYLYFEGSFRFEISFSSSEFKRRIHITQPFYKPIDSCALNLIAIKLQNFAYEGPDQIFEDSFYFIWPEKISDS